MHDEARVEMDRILSLWPQINGAARLLDVGSFDVNGSYRELVERRGWEYLGIDIAPGKNVDIVSEDPYTYPFDDGSWDVVISGSTMEHVPEIWRWVPELARLLRPGGMLAIITHTHWRFHPHPLDCWRIMPDGMQYLFDATGMLEHYQIDMYCPTDISAVAWRKAAA